MGPARWSRRRLLGAILGGSAALWIVIVAGVWALLGTAP